MPLDEILTLLRARPFQPFRIRAVGDRVYEINHPEMVLPLARSLHVAVPGDAGGHPERADLVALIHVQTLEPVTPAA